MRHAVNNTLFETGLITVLVEEAIGGSVPAIVIDVNSE